MFGAQQRPELVLANAAAETLTAITKARVLEHFGQKAGLQFARDGSQGIGVFRRLPGLRRDRRAGQRQSCGGHGDALN